MVTYDFSLFCRWHVKDTAPKEMGSNKQRKGGVEICRRVHIIRLKKDEIYGIINAGRLADASLGLRPLRTLCACVIDGFAKMSLQANIFASWYNKVSKIRR